MCTDALPTKFFPREPCFLVFNAKAGLLTCSRIERLPEKFVSSNLHFADFTQHLSGKSIIQHVEKSLQQRDCSGFTPDSLLITAS